MPARLRCTATAVTGIPAGYRSPVQWGSFAALGDSFTEGLDDPYPGRGEFRGWADLVATALAQRRSGFRYANLAIRGRLFGRVVSEQVPPALAMRPDLISFSAGINDALRRNFDPGRLVAKFDAIIGDLRAGGADVILFRYADGIAHLPGQRVVGRRIAILNQAVLAAGERHGARVVDLAGDAELANPALWSTDRLHLASAGHHRVAAHVLAALGMEPDPAWWDAPSWPGPSPWLTARTADLAWAGRHLVPWLKRRLTGRSSGDGVTAKRPILTPFLD
jgi:lysophospholipase L1-like esterase